MTLPPEKAFCRLLRLGSRLHPDTWVLEWWRHPLLISMGKRFSRQIKSLWPIREIPLTFNIFSRTQLIFLMALQATPHLWRLVCSNPVALLLIQIFLILAWFQRRPPLQRVVSRIGSVTVEILHIIQPDRLILSPTADRRKTRAIIRIKHWSSRVSLPMLLILARMQTQSPP